MGVEKFLVKGTVNVILTARMQEWQFMLQKVTLKAFSEQE